MPVAELLKRVSALELAEWRAFEEIYGPIGVEARLDRTAAVIAQQVANSFRPPKTKPAPLSDFMPRWDARLVEGYGEDEEVDADGGGAA
ncbi:MULTISPECIES: hypothetical protein [unclassified Nonomuraea]|uniref:phage tail assembly protein T n=1 Tax=unclassified Nonomuraea TaxID=2593643 RepID=UPI0033CA1D50